MRLSYRAVFTLFITAGILGCDADTPTSPSGLLLTTDSSSYTASPIGYSQVAVRIITKYRNPTNAPIELERCLPDTPYPTYNVELVAPNDPQGAGYNPDWACGGPDKQIIVAPGDVRTDTLTLRGPSAFDNNLGKYLGVLEGTFRVAYGGQQSNEFTIKLPPAGVVPNVSRDVSAAIQTDSLLLHLKVNGPVISSAAIHLVIYNPRPDTSFIINCNGATGVSLEKQSGTQWVGALSSVVPLCYSSPIVIPPGGQYETSIMIAGGSSGSNVAPQFTMNDLPGVYRFVWSQIVGSFNAPEFTPPTWGPPIPADYRRSNAFAVIVDR